MPHSTSNARRDPLQSSDTVRLKPRAQVKNGGVLNVAEGAKATFMGTAEFSDNSVLIKQLGTVSCGEGCTRVGPGQSYATKKGGAIHNKVRATRSRPRWSIFYWDGVSRSKHEEDSFVKESPDGNLLLRVNED